MSPDRFRALYAALKSIPNVPPPVVVHASEASARAMVEACGLPWVDPRPRTAEPPMYPLSGWDVRAAIALDVDCGGDVVVLTGAR